MSVAAGLLTLFGDVRARTHAIKMMIETQGVGAGAPGCVFAISYFLTAASFLVALAAFVAFAIRNTAF